MIVRRLTSNAGIALACLLLVAGLLAPQRSYAFFVVVGNCIETPVLKGAWQDSSGVWHYPQWIVNCSPSAQQYGTTSRPKMIGGPSVDAPATDPTQGNPNIPDPLVPIFPSTPWPSDTPQCSQAALPPGEYCGNPISISTGNKYQKFTDYAGAGPFPLIFERYYNSLGSSTSSIGANWSHTYSGYVWQTSASTVNVVRGGQKTLTFTQTNGVWTPDADVTARLVQQKNAQGATTGWVYTTGADNVETYDGSGRLISITARSGLTQALGYNAQGLLSTVSDQYGRSLTFAYSGGCQIDLIALICARNPASGATAYQLASVTDPAGRVYSYSYDTSWNLASVTFPDGASQSYVYEDAAYPHALTGLIDENGVRYATWSYDANGLAISSQHAGGADATSVTYDFVNGVSHVIDALNNAYSYQYDTIAGVQHIQQVTVPLPAGSTAQDNWAYDANGNVASHEDFLGQWTAFSYDTTRNLEIARMLADGTTVNTTWHPTLRLPTLIQEGTRFDQRTYDARGNLLQRTVADSSSGTSRAWNYTYNSVGQPLTVSDPDSHVSKFVYDNQGNTTSVTDAAGHVTKLLHDVDGRVTQVTDPNGLVTTFAFDARGRLLSKNIGGLNYQYGYDSAGNLTSVVRPDGYALTLVYDGAHRLVSVTNNLGAKLAYTLDALGNHIQEQASDSSGNVAWRHGKRFDTLNRLAQSIGAQGQTTTLQYDKNSNVVSVSDPLAQITTVAYDALNRPVSNTDPTGATTTLTYDTLGNVAAVTDARGLQTQYTYDALGDRVGVVSPDTGPAAETFDLAGNVLTSTDAVGRLASYSYDALDRVTQIRYSGVTSTNFSYDQGPNGIGRLTSMADASGSTSWTHDRLGHVVTKTQSVGTRQLGIQYGYDTAGRLVSITYPSGAVVQYSYSADLITQVSINGSPVLSNVTYQAFHGPANAWTWSNGTSYRRGFDTDARLAQYPLGQRSRQLSFDGGSRIIGYSDSDSTRSQSFTYDGADRLTGYSASAGSEQYGYDALGNRTSLVSTFSGASSASYGYSAASNQLVGQTVGSQTASLTYDSTGNIVSDGVNRFSYDGRSRLIEASNAQGLTYYALNGLGQRVAKLSGPPPDLAGDANHDGVLDTTDLRLIALMITGADPVDLAADCNRDGQVTVADVSCVSAKIVSMRLSPQNYVEPASTAFAYDEAGRLIGEYGAAGSTETVYLGDLPVAVLKGGAVYYVYADHLNAPRVIVKSSGAPVWDWEGGPFGDAPANQDPSSTGTQFVYNLRFPGQYYDAETGLHYNMARDYDPRTGRYIQSDPIGLAGGLNSYSYAAGTPVHLTDSSGEFIIPIIIAAWDIGVDGFVACARIPRCQLQLILLGKKLYEVGEKLHFAYEQYEHAKQNLERYEQLQKQRESNGSQCGTSPTLPDGTAFPSLDPNAWQVIIRNGTQIADPLPASRMNIGPDPAKWQTPASWKP